MKTAIGEKKRAKFTSFRPRIRSRHPSHADLRSKNGKKLPLLKFKSVVRFGSQHVYMDTVEFGGQRIELNSVNSIKNSSNKLLMKECFTKNEVTQCQWYTVKKENDEYIFTDKITNEVIKVEDIPFPIVTKHIYGSRGTGNKKHNTYNDLKQWLDNKNNLPSYILEKFYNYNREYRLHVSKNGCFYTCRKVLRNDTEQGKRWYRNNDNCNWLLEDNPSFDKPANWDKIVKQCVKALEAVGLDFGAVDLRIQSAKDKKEQLRDDPKFVIIEINSAPSFGDITKLRYIEEIPKLLTEKWQNLKAKEKKSLLESTTSTQ